MAIGVLRIGSCDVGPGATGMTAPEQSRTFTEVIEIAPLPSAPTDFRSIVNSWPPPVTPHGDPSRLPSTVNDPAPLSTTWNTVLVNAPSQLPAWMLAAGGPVEQSPSLTVSMWNVTL